MAISGQTFGDFGSAVSDLFSYFGAGYQEQGLQYEEQSYKAAQQLALQNEQFAKTSTAIKQAQAQRQTFQALGRTQAAVGGAGLAQSGSAIDLLRSSAQQGATTTAVLGQQGLIQQAGYAEQATAYGNMVQAAQTAISAEKTASLGDLIGGGLKLAAGLGSIAL